MHIYFVTIYIHPSILKFNPFCEICRADTNIYRNKAMVTTWVWFGSFGWNLCRVLSCTNLQKRFENQSFLWNYKAEEVYKEMVTTQVRDLVIGCDLRSAHPLIDLHIFAKSFWNSISFVRNTEWTRNIWWNKEMVVTWVWLGGFGWNLCRVLSCTYLQKHLENQSFCGGRGILRNGHNSG